MEACPSGELAVECSGWLFEDGYFQEGLFCVTTEEFIAQVELCHSEYGCSATSESDHTAFACSWWSWCD